MAQLPSGSQELSVSKLLPKKHVACQLTKGQEGEKNKTKRKTLERAEPPRVLPGEEGVSLVVLLVTRSRKKIKTCDYKHLHKGKEELGGGSLP